MSLCLRETSTRRKEDRNKKGRKSLRNPPVSHRQKKKKKRNHLTSLCDPRSAFLFFVNCLSKTMKKLLFLVLAVLLATVSNQGVVVVDAAIGPWEDLALPIDYVGDFALLGPVGAEKKTLLVIIEGGFSSREAGLTVVVVDTSSSAPMTILSKEGGFCPNIALISYSPQAFMPINSTSLALHCTANSGSSAVYVFSIDPTTYSLVLINKAVFLQGWEFALPSPVLPSSALLDSPTTLWFVINSFFALTVRMGGVSVDTLELVYNNTFTPGLDSGSSFALPPLPSNRASSLNLGTAVLNQVYSETVVDRLSSYALPSSALLHSLPNVTYGVNSFAASSTIEDGSGTGIFITTEGDIERQPTVVNISQCAWRSFECSPAESLVFPRSASYSGYSNGPIASIWDNKYAYVPFFVEVGLQIDQLLLAGLTSPPRLLGDTFVLYEYSHRILANNDFLFCDTNAATISRASVNATAT